MSRRIAPDAPPCIPRAGGAVFRGAKSSAGQNWSLGCEPRQRRGVPDAIDGHRGRAIRAPLRRAGRSLRADRSKRPASVLVLAHGSTRRTAEADSQGLSDSAHALDRSVPTVSPCTPGADGAVWGAAKSSAVPTAVLAERAPKARCGRREATNIGAEPFAPPASRRVRLVPRPRPSLGRRASVPSLSTPRTTTAAATPARR